MSALDYQVVLTSAEKRASSKYAEDMQSHRYCQADQKPFYCVVNIADPHKPFFNDESPGKTGFDEFKLSEILTPKKVSIPPFLPKDKEIHQEMCNYYNSVKRGDDCVGAVIETLRKMI